MRRILACALALSLSLASFAGAQPSKPRGEARNAWRYVLYNGRWWYWTPDDQWSLFNGRRWETFSPDSIGSSLRASARDAAGSRPRSQLSSSLEADARSILNSTRPRSPLGAAPAPLGATPGGAFGREARTMMSPIRVETVPTRSGDANSGVGGGSVGGTSVTGSTSR